MIFKSHKSQKGDKYEEVEIVSLDERACRALQDENEANRLIEEFLPFIKSRVRRFIYGYDEIRFDDYQSIAMLAFYEAIKSYDQNRGHFLTFANQIIKLRLIDGLRKESRYQEKIVLLSDEKEPYDNSPASTAAAMSSYAFASQNALLSMEIEQFKMELQEWEITLLSLYEQSPKHNSLQKTCRQVVIQCYENQEITEIIQVKRYLPIKKIAKLTNVPEKKLERVRKYLLASLIILTGDYEYLAEYIKLNGGGAV